MLEEDKYFTELSNIKTTSPKVYKSALIRGMTITEVKRKMKVGSEQYLTGNYSAALQEYTSVYNAVDKFGNWYLNITERELIALKYALATVNFHCDSKENMDHANALFTKLKQYDFPAAYYGKAKLLCKYERYSDAKLCCMSGLTMIENKYKSEKYVWPGTLEIIEETKTEKLKELLENLTKTCDVGFIEKKDSNNFLFNDSHPHYVNSNWENIPISATCKYASCSFNRSIKATYSLDGYYIIQCSDNCCIYYHSKCWKLMKKSKALITDQKTFLAGACLTPDCCGIINLIQMYNKRNELQNEFPIENDLNKKHRKNKLEKREEKKKLKKQRTKALSCSSDKSSIENDPLDLTDTVSNPEIETKMNSQILKDHNPKSNRTNKIKKDYTVKPKIKQNEISWTVLSKDGKIRQFENKNKKTENFQRSQNTDIGTNLLLYLKEINDIFGPLNTDDFLNFCEFDDDDVMYLIEYGGLNKFLQDNRDHINLRGKIDQETYNFIPVSSKCTVRSLYNQNFYEVKEEKETSNNEDSVSENKIWKEKYFKVTKIHEEEKQAWAIKKTEFKEKMERKNKDYINETNLLKEEIEELQKRRNLAERYCFEMKKKFCLEKMTDCISTAEKNMQLLQNRYLSKCSPIKNNSDIVEEISLWQYYKDKCKETIENYFQKVDNYLKKVTKDNLKIDIYKYDIPSPPSVPCNPNNVINLAVLDECPICFETILNQEEECTPCEHKFHVKCLQSWLKKETTCPVCRSHVLSFEEFPRLTRCSRPAPAHLSTRP
ncbi:uncharacterized protein LOC111625909 isoform X2 [Centruroides sculpturatus]|uniref:uncharacterized protein LOC111625909 isoform X2 n=1 Tax=Centruroides sculpturatus TaxID=218467 RepID=UPI000C6E4682|nr:uncharacterized protein LOC111625909 isoform X2 [Centruroides sculpturatus]